MTPELIDAEKMKLINRKAEEMVLGFFDLSHFEAMALLLQLSDRIAVASGHREEFWDHYQMWVSRLVQMIEFGNADGEGETIN